MAAPIPGPSPIKMSPEDRQSSLALATELLALGKRNLLVSSIHGAVNDFGEACHLLSRVYGEMAVECAEAYFFYGKSLLEISRLEAGVLGNALQGVDMMAEDDAPMDDEMIEDPEKLSKIEKLEVEKGVHAALEDNYEKHDKIAMIHNPEGEDTDEEDQDEDMEEEVGEKSKEVGGGEQMETEDKMETGEEAGAKADDEPSDLQLAWEMLELAKVLYINISNNSSGDRKKDADEKVSDVFLSLGEVSLENEEYELSVDDLTVCLRMRKETLPADSRSIAETCYQLGVALAFAGKFPEAETNLNMAIDVLEARHRNLGAMGASDNVAKEITDLVALVNEIKDKIMDTKDMEKGTMQMAKEGKVIPAFLGSSSGRAARPIEVRSGAAKAAKETEAATVGIA